MDNPATSSPAAAPRRAAPPLSGLVGAVVFMALGLVAPGCEGGAEGGRVALPLTLDGSAFEAAAKVTLPERQADELPGLHNVYPLSANVLSGSEPENEQAFAELARLGVKTILSVDGKQPSVETAAKYGLSYVHVPIQYSGIDDSELAAITKTFREEQGPFYVHCFHGKHRGPAAAAVGRLVLDGVERTEALAEMRQYCGTSPDYEGLYATIAQASIPTAAQTAALDIDLSAARPFDGVRGVMIPMPRAFDALKAVQPRAFAVDPSHPDLDAVHEAEILAELFGTLVELPPEDGHGNDFREWMLAGQAATVELHAALAAARADLAPTQPLEGSALDRANAAFKDVGASCKACHAVYRD